MSPVVVEDLEKVWEAAAKKLTGVVMHKGNAYERVRRVPTLLTNLDYAMGWGIPLGRWALFYGLEGSGKTLAAYRAIASAQRYPEVIERLYKPMIQIALERADVEMAEELQREIDYTHNKWPNGMKCVFYNVEQRFDEDFARKLGVNTDELEVIESQVIEDICNSLSTLYGVSHMHVIDSMSNAVSLEELGDKAGTAADARAWTRQLKKTMRYWDNQENFGILIAQMRSNVRENTLTVSAPRFASFNSSMSVNFAFGKMLYYDKDGLLADYDTNKKATGETDKRSPAAGGREADGRSFYAKVDKASVSRPFLSASMRWDHHKLAFDDLFEIANAGIHTGVVEMNGSYFKLPGSDRAVQGEAKYRAALAQDPALQDRIRAALLLNNNGLLG